MKKTINNFFQIIVTLCFAACWSTVSGQVNANYNSCTDENFCLGIGTGVRFSSGLSAGGRVNACVGNILANDVTETCGGGELSISAAANFALAGITYDTCEGVKLDTDDLIEFNGITISGRAEIFFSSEGERETFSLRIPSITLDL